MNLNSEQEKKDFSAKSTYSNTEKDYIMKTLNSKRLETQEEKNKKYSKEEKNKFLKQLNDRRLKERDKNSNIKKTENKSNSYSNKEKEKLLQSINDKRLEEELYKEMDIRRTGNKKIYMLDIIECNKFEYMDREYFINKKDINALSTAPKVITMFYRTFGEIKKRDFLMKIELYSDKIFISNDVLRVYFKAYSLERAE